MTPQATLRPFAFILIVLFFSPAILIAQETIAPTTTLAAETANNTSAADTFKTQPDGNIGATNISKLSVQSLLYSGSTTTLFAHVVTWFGDPGHMNVGYTSSDSAQIHKQVTDMLSRGIAGAVLDWDGPEVALSTNTIAGFRTEAESQGGNFEFAVMEDVNSVVQYAQQNGCDVTQKIIADLNYASTNFEVSTAYLRNGGRPVVFFFGTEDYYVDWNKVRSSVSGNPQFIFENYEGFGWPQSGGAFGWMNLDSGNPGNQDLGGLDSLYSAAQQNPSKLVYGAGYKGFNDTLADWSGNRVMSQQCGETWLATLAEAGKYYSSSNQLPYLQLVTWNDYEEGTEVETGIDNCITISASTQGSNLNWALLGSGQENTVSTFRVWISNDSPTLPAGSQQLMKLADVPPGTHSLDLSQYGLGPSTYTLFLEAIGKASIANQMSPAVTYRPGHQPPSVGISASPNTGTAPVTVTATVNASAASDSTISSTSIDFGDGAIMNGPVASHQYGNAGTYMLKGTATDSLGVSSSATTTVTITASPNYGVNISSPAPGNINSQFVEVRATAASPNPPITAIWVYVDQVVAYQSQNQSSIDASLKLDNGSHYIEVQAWDWTGALFKSGVTINVLPPQSTLVAALDVTPLSALGQYGVMACTARSTDSNGFITSSMIDFGDGTTQSGTTGLHNYAAAGTYNVKTTVTDNHGYTSSSTSNITVQPVGNTPPFGYLDHATNANGTTTVAQNAMMQVSGWAADNEDGAPVAQVQVFLDGSAVGDATLGLSRPDVASAYNRSDFTNSGWSFSYNVGSLTLGTHQFTAVAFDSQGASAQLSNYNGAGNFSVQADTPPFGYLQSALNWYNGTTTLPQYGNLQLFGWAADNEDGAPVNHVNVLLDGNVIGQATLGQSRPDVANAYGRSDFTNSGWTFIYNIGNLSTGAHNVTAVAFDSQGASTQLTSYHGAGPFTVQADTPPFGYVDHVANASDGSTTVPQNGLLSISGWAADNEDGAPLPRVAVLIDGNLVGNATLGQSRPDVANVYKRSDFTNSGWSFSFNVGTLTPGTHSVSAVAYDSQGVSQTLANYQNIGQFTAQ